MDFLNHVVPAVQKAILVDLPEVEYVIGNLRKLRRPNPSECFVYVFPQEWQYPTLGFDNVMDWKDDLPPTWAYTVVVIAPGNTVAAVYFSGMLAYVVPVSSDLAYDVARQSMKSVKEAHKHYGRDPRSSDHGRRPGAEPEAVAPSGCVSES